MSNEISAALRASLPHIEPTTQALLAQPLGSQFFWGSSRVRLHREELDKALIEYLDEPRYGHAFWLQGTCGGFSLGSDYPEALAEFRRSVNDTRIYWGRIIKRDSIIVQGHHYMDKGTRLDAESYLLGFNGRMWFIKRLADNSIFSTNNLWLQGEIPRELRPPDTCEFITEEQFRAELAS